MEFVKPKVLIADDEKELRESLSATLQHMGFCTVLAANGEEAIQKSKEHSLAVAILDVNMPKKSGLEALRAIKEHDPSVIVLMITAHGNVSDAVEAVKEGAFNYIEKPVKESHLKAVVENASKTQQAVMEVGLSSPTLKLENGQEFVGQSQQMKSVFLFIQRLANVSTPVLIQGENGTGKELVASAIHQYGPRKEKRFVALNCGAISEEQMESEFFGHEKGAVAGARSRQIGKFQFAEGGTLFLDEISELSLPMQVKLLRALQERNFTPAGSTREIRCDVRIITATNKDLNLLVKEGTFRQDLYYRLNVLPISIPALKDRQEDIPYLANHFLRKFNQLHGRFIEGIEAETLEVMKKYSWPGNIREFENAIERALVMETGLKISIGALPEQVAGKVSLQIEQEKNTAPSPPIADPSAELNVEGIDFQVEKEEFERQFIISALKRFGGRINQTVARANIPKNTLLRKIRKYEIRPPEYGVNEKNHLENDLDQE